MSDILVTGVPGVGKTTLIRRVAGDLSRRLRETAYTGDLAGFYTQEIRKQGIRQGFELVGLDGRKGILSHIDFKGGPSVGRYGVDVAGFEAFLESLPRPGPDVRLFIIDEIGKMECLSGIFRAWLTSLLDSKIPVIATIALRGTPFIEALKLRPDVRMFELTTQNREMLPGAIFEAVRNIMR